jgi:hypothetical protein
MLILLGAGGTAQADFLSDSKATLSMRNLYFNNDNRQTKQVKQEEWGQGFLLKYQSGFTDGTVGFGVDAIGALGIKLDSGEGRHNGSSFFPSDDGKAVDEFSAMGLTAKARISKTELRYGTLQPVLPVLVNNDGRLIPQWFKGAQMTSKEVDDLTVTLGGLEDVKDRNSTDSLGLAVSGAGGLTGQRSNKFYYGGFDYKITPNLLAQYYASSLEDFYTQNFLGLVHTLPLAVGKLTSDLRYFHSDSDGKNSSAAGRTEGYVSTGYYGDGVTKGEVDNDTFSATFTYAVGGHTLIGGYQVVNGDSNMPFINQGSGSTVYLTSNSQITSFTRAGERTWMAGYGYDFASVGVPGLTSKVMYLAGDKVKSVRGDLNEWERDFALSYVVQSGLLKGVGITWLNGLLRGSAANDTDENRLYVSYSLPLF